MINDINNLINEVYHSNLQKQQLMLHQREVEFQMLANQVNPHFLFNMLESIRMKAHQENANELADIIQNLAFMLRRNLKLGTEVVPISYEIETLENYLKLIHFRFKDRISYSLCCEDNIHSYMIDRKSVV